MADLSKYSDEELENALKQKKSIDLSKYSDEELQAALESKPSTSSQLLDAATNRQAFQAYGAAAGGVIGALGGGPLGAVAGAGLGQAAMGSLRDAIGTLAQTTLEKEARLPTQDELVNLSKQLGIDFVQGAAAEGGGQVVAKGLGAAMQTPIGQQVSRKAGQLVDDVNQAGAKIAEKIRPTELKPNSKEIIEAGRKIGADITPAMLDKSDFVARLEYTLANSPSYVGQSVKARQQAIEDALRSNIDEITKSASSLSPNQLGQRVQAGMIAETGSRLDPAAAAFQDVLDSTKNIPVNERSVSAIVRNIEEIPSYRLSEGAGKPSFYVKMIKNAQNANDLKEINSMIGADIRSKNIDSTEKYILSQMKEKISRLESNSIMRSAIQQAKEGGMKKATGEKIGSEIVETLKGARKQYRELSADLQAIAKDAGLKVTNPKSFIDAVEELPAEKIQQKFFNVENNRLLVNLKRNFPDEFELLKQGKMAEILEKSVNNTQGFGGGVSAQRFMTQVRNLNPEAQSLLFSDDALKTIKAIDLIQKNMPKNFNPSGSGNQLGWQELVIKNLKDIPTYLIYKGASSNIAKEMGDFLVKVPKLMELKVMNPKSFNSLVETASKAYISSADSKKFPMVVRKNGQRAIIKNEQELKEAKSEGWR